MPHLREYQQFCDERGIRFVVVVFPQRYQVDPEDWRLAVEHYRLRKEAFDVDLPNRKIAEFCRDNAIELLDPLLEMRSAGTRKGRSHYFPRGDILWNERGHSAVASYLERALAFPTDGG